MRSRFFLLFAALMMFIFLALPLSALEHDPGDRPTLPETTNFAKKFNKFMEPISFGVGSEPGLESIAVYLYLIYDYGKDFSWMVRLEMESIIKSDSDLDSKNIMHDSLEFEIDKHKHYDLSVLPFIKRYKYADMGFGLTAELYRYDIQGMGVYDNYIETCHYDVDIILLGPLFYLRWEYPITKLVDIGGTTNISPVQFAWQNTDGWYKYYENNVPVDKGSVKDRDTGYGAPALCQDLYISFIKFINLSTRVEFDYFKLNGDEDVAVYDTVLRVGVSILKKPKSGFLNYLIGVFYENEWTYYDMAGEKSKDHEKRWIFCIGASG